MTTGFGSLLPSEPSVWCVRNSICHGVPNLHRNGTPHTCCASNRLLVGICQPDKFLESRVSAAVCFQGASRACHWHESDAVTRPPQQLGRLYGIDDHSSITLKSGQVNGELSSTWSAPFHNQMRLAQEPSLRPCGPSRLPSAASRVRKPMQRMQRWHLAARCIRGKPCQCRVVLPKGFSSMSVA